MDKTYWYGRAKHPISVVAGLENALHPSMFTYHDCPESRCRDNGMLADIVAHLNDLHRWSLEDIADWIENEATKSDA